VTAAEIPFEMIDREEGVSTLNRKVLWQSLRAVPAYRALFDLPPKRVSGLASAPSEFRLMNYKMVDDGARYVRVAQEN
jgi:hypothetical protein